MIVNPDKFQAILFQKGNKNKQNYKLQIDTEVIATTDSVKLLGITIDDKLNFYEYISNVCKKTQSN